MCEFNVVNGIIQNPGKFEGSPDWTPYYWDLVMNGEGEDIYDCPEDYDDDLDDKSELHHTEFTVDSEESDKFGLECGSIVCVCQDDNGFVSGWILD